MCECPIRVTGTCCSSNSRCVRKNTAGCLAYAEAEEKGLEYGLHKGVYLIVTVMTKFGSISRPFV